LADCKIIHCKSEIQYGTPFWLQHKANKKSLLTALLLLLSTTVYHIRHTS